MIFNAFVSIVHNTLYKTFFIYDIEGTMLGVIEIIEIVATKMFLVMIILISLWNVE